VVPSTHRRLVGGGAPVAVSRTPAVTASHSLNNLRIRNEH